MAASKTNPQAGGRTPGFKTSILKKRYVGEKEVKPTLYCGRWEGYGSYISGTVDGELVRDSNGKPLSFKQIGELR